MIDIWFKEDIAKRLVVSHRLVVRDESGSASWLLNYCPGSITVMTVCNEADELKARYEAEKHYAGEDVIFYAKLPIGKLTFLTEYAETGGMLDLSNTGEYIRRIAFGHLHTNTAIGSDNLVIAAKLSCGKDETWWRGVMKGVIRPLDVKKQLPDLLDHPATLGMEPDVWRLFSKEVYALLGLPDTRQQPEALAKEAVKVIFDRLADGTIDGDLLDIYYAWADKSSMRQSFTIAVENYDLSTEASPLKAHPDHPFEAMDRRLFRLLSRAVKDGADTSALMHTLHLRLDSMKARTWKQPWLADVATLMDFEMPTLYKVNTLDGLAAFYCDTFCPLDAAMRRLYEAWLNDTDTLRPLQERYEQHEKALLDKWFSLTDSYTPTQQGLIEKAFAGNLRTAVIVGDGLRLEIAEDIAKRVTAHGKKAPVRETAFARLPSVTENGMSALYGVEGVDTVAQSRFAHLKSKVNGVEIMSFDHYNDSITAHRLVLNYGDIDEVAEKKQLAGLKDIGKYPEEIANMVRQLLNRGYDRVYITADHGFVLTGILDDADKVPAPHGDVKVLERYVLANETLDDSDLIERPGEFSGYPLQYFSHSDKPFVSKGSYGYAHGGFTPQECIIPFYCFKGEDAAYTDCNVTIANKQELKNITGSYFKVKLKAEGNAGQLFDSLRVKVTLYEGSEKKSEVIQTLRAGEETQLEFEINKEEGKVIVVDAATTRQLDHCELKKSSSRDLGGLL